MMPLLRVGLFRTNRRRDSMSQQRSNAVSGFVKLGFEAVHEAFVENFTRRNDLGASCCIYYKGEKVVDLWGGIRNKATGEPWEENTMVAVFSTAKGMTGFGTCTFTRLDRLRAARLQLLAGICPRG